MKGMYPWVRYLAKTTHPVKAKDFFITTQLSIFRKSYPASRSECRFTELRFAFALGCVDFVLKVPDG